MEARRNEVDAPPEWIVTLFNTRIFYLASCLTVTERAYIIDPLKVVSLIHYRSGKSLSRILTAYCRVAFIHAACLTVEAFSAIIIYRREIIAGFSAETLCHGFIQLRGLACLHFWNAGLGLEDVQSGVKVGRDFLQIFPITVIRGFGFGAWLDLRCGVFFYCLFSGYIFRCWGNGKFSFWKCLSRLILEKYSYQNF